MRTNDERDLRRLILRRLGERTGLVTLAANVANTNLIDARIRFDSPVLLVPTTANAAAEFGNGTLFLPEAGRANGAIVIAHANNAQGDRTFRYLIG
jgi:hypothetical protein